MVTVMLELPIIYILVETLLGTLVTMEAGSGLDADNLDGKTWNSSGKDLRGTEIYADNWFRNYNVGEGLYNQATDVILFQTHQINGV